MFLILLPCGRRRELVENPHTTRFRYSCIVSKSRRVCRLYGSNILSEMAQAQVQPSGSDLSKVENDIVQTISLADTIITLIREPIALVYKNVTKAQQLKRSLGLWQEEALDDTGQCRIPVLPLKGFEEHLVRTDGAVPAVTSASGSDRRARISWGSWWAQNPNSSPRLELPSAGTACWAYFLFALGIRPGMDVVAWRPSTDGFINTQNGGIEMEVEGSVLCHIINLFSVTLNPEPWTRAWAENLPDRRRERHCDFPFGRLVWTTAGDQIHAHFTPGLESELASAKQPFGVHGTLMDRGTIMASYLTALLHGVSDSKYRLAPPNAALPERISRLTTCFDMLSLRRLPQPEKPLLISYAWFEEAARIKRRVLAQGGEDHSFFQDICEAINNDPYCEAINDYSYFDPDSSKFMRYKSMRTRVRDLFLLDEETFTFSVPGARDLSEPWEEVMPISYAEATLLGYEHQPAGSWKRSLFDMKAEVVKVLAISNNITLWYDDKVQLIEFTSWCDLWNKKVFLGFPVSM
jgi:hypothetical protein